MYSIALNTAIKGNTRKTYREYKIAANTIKAIFSGVDTELNVSLKLRLSVKINTSFDKQTIQNFKGLFLLVSSFLTRKAVCDESRTHGLEAGKDS